jgi:hypothetical protein
MANVYTLKLKGEARNIYSETIDNLYWSFLDWEMVHEIPATRIIEYFFDAIPFNPGEARRRAFQLCNQYALSPLNRVIININKTWDQILLEAKELAPKEIESIKERITDDRYDSDIAFLENIILM